MRAPVFILIVLASGASAGLVHGAVNMALVEPYLDTAIEIENQNMFAAGAASDTPEFRAEYEGYRSWQKSGMVLATVVLGMSVGSLFGIVFALLRDSLPGRSHVKKAVILAGVMWLVLFAVPFLKYPANPPAVGDPGDADARAASYALLVAVSGAGAVLFYRVSRSLPGAKKVLAPAGYALLMSVMFAVLPEGPGGAAGHEDLVAGFRITSVVAVTSFWGSVGIFLGAFWSRLDPPGAAR